MKVRDVSCGKKYFPRDNEMLPVPENQPETDEMRFAIVAQTQHRGTLAGNCVYFPLLSLFWHLIREMRDNIKFSLSHEKRCNFINHPLF